MKLIIIMILHWHPRLPQLTQAAHHKEKKNDKVADLLNQNKVSRNKLIETLNKIKSVEDDVDIFYKSITVSIKRLPPDLIAEAKMQNLQTLHNLELQHRQNQQQKFYYNLPSQQDNQPSQLLLRQSHYPNYQPHSHPEMQHYRYEKTTGIPKTFHQPLKTHSSSPSNLPKIQQYHYKKPADIPTTLNQPLETPRSSPSTL